MLSPPQYLARESKIGTSLISKWASNKAEIVKEASGEVTKDLFAKQLPRRWFPEAEQQLYELFLARRKRKLNVSTLWVTVTYRKLLRDMYPHNPKEVAFLPSYRWAQRWANRHNLSKRRRSNLKNKSVEERLLQIRRFIRRVHKLIQEPARRKGHVVSDAEAGVRAVQPRDPMYGRFQLNERFNSDQVPLPFVNRQSETWATKGNKRVSIAQPFSGLEKRQCTIQPTIGPGGKLMQCAIICRGTGKRISKVEKKAYDPRVDVFFQKNAWADSDFCMAWAKRCFCKSLMRGGGGVPAEESLLTLDNLHGQTTEKFKAYMKKECDSLVWHYPVGCTDALRPIDAGLAELIKVEVGEQLDIWLENGDNLERWENNALTVSDRRVTKWVATAVDIVDNRPNYRFACSRRQGAS